MARRRRPLVEGSDSFLEDLRQATLKELTRPVPEARRRYRPVGHRALDRMFEAASRVADRHRRQPADPGETRGDDKGSRV